MKGPSAFAIAFHDLTLAYDGRPAVAGLTGSLACGSLTAIVGPNGAGKSTLLKGIVGSLRPARGKIERARLGSCGIAYLPQHAEIDKQFPIAVIDTVLLGHWRRMGWARAADRELREEARRALEAVGLAGFEARLIETLSAGEFQRVLFARLIAQDSGLILLDEPFSAVDWRTSEDMLRLIAAWHSEGRTVAAVLHDLDQVRAYFPETLLIARQCIAWGATRDVLMPHNLQRARGMSDARSSTAADYGRVSAGA